MFPKPKFHVTVDTLEKRSTLEDIMRLNPQLMLPPGKLVFRTNVAGEVLTLSPQTTTWACSTCGTPNALTQKECSDPQCDQWRPQQQRPGDWVCCQQVNFASRSTCYKCNRPRAPELLSAMAAYNAPPSAPAPAGVRRMPDWRCPTCEFVIWGSKERCSKCGTRNPNL